MLSVNMANVALGSLALAGMAQGWHIKLFWTEGSCGKEVGDSQREGEPRASDECNLILSETRQLLVTDW